LSILLQKIPTKKDLTLSDKYLFYQASLLLVKRKSSASLQTNENLLEMTTLTKNFEKTISNYWKNNESYLSFFRFLYLKQQEILFQWLESIHKFPNSIPHYEEFSIFYVECLADFEKGVFIKYQRDLLENGANFFIDHCFRNFIQIYPEFVRLKIFDLRGNFASEKNSKHCQNDNTPFHLSHTDFSFSVIDPHIEEQICSRLLTFPKARIALQKVFQGQSTKSHFNLKILSFFSFCFMFILFFLFILF
jgi:hypothetical protein